MLFSIVLLAVGIGVLIVGANGLVNGASSLAKRNRVSDLAIGLTIVAFGTSAPELVVNVIASGGGHSEIVLGNILGSNNFNLFIILGISALIFPIAVQSSTIWKEIPISILSALVFLFLATNFFSSGSQFVSRFDGIILLIGFFLFLYYVFTSLKSGEVEIESFSTTSLGKTWLLIVLGLGGLILGGKLIVDNSIFIATELGLSQKIIGLTIIAAGTSLPELITSIVAAIKKNSDIAIGNVIGSNIFNLLLILPISSFVHPISYDSKFTTDVFILIGGTLFLLLAMWLGRRRVLDRWEGAVILVFYIAYTISLF